LSHLEFDLRSPVWQHWLRELSRDHTYVRYDERGCGLSDWSPPELSFDAWVSDLEAVVDMLGLRRFPLFGMSQGGAIAIAYAARHPEKVSHLVLFGAYARGVLRREITPQQREEAQTLVKLIRLGWGRDNPAFRQVFTTQFMPGAKPEQQQWFNELARVSASPDNAARILEIFHQIDVVHLAARLKVPTLVMHSQDDARAAFEEGRRMAATIPSARFVPLASSNHVLLETEPAWAQFLAEMRGFIGVGATTEAIADLTPSERQVLELLARGLDNVAIATELGKGGKTVRNQISSIFSKLGVRTRAEAIVMARDLGIGGK
jgi:pimeloyl-ACP methyl ester carboxylesterase